MSKFSASKILHKRYIGDDPERIQSLEEERRKREYKVVWTIEVDAESPQEAAKEAREIMLNPESEAVVFEVGGKLIDLLDT